MIPSYKTRNQKYLILAAAMVLFLSIVPVTAVTIIDDAGMSVTLNTTPTHIVSLAPSNTEILASLGLLDRVVGVTDVCNYPPEVKNITRIGGYSSLSIEKIAASQPDLVVASDITPKETVNRLRDLGLTVVVIAPRNIDQVLQDMYLVGNLTGSEVSADQLVANLSRRIDAVSSHRIDEYRPTVAHVVWHQPLYISGNDTLQDDVIKHAGGTNVFADRDGWSTVTLEEFLQKNPDIILVSGGGGMDTSKKDVIREAFMTGPQYTSLSAVKNNRVYAVNADIISRASPRIVDATEQVARVIQSAGSASSGPTSPAPSSITPSAPGFCAGTCILLAGLVMIVWSGKR